MPADDESPKCDGPAKSDLFAVLSSVCAAVIGCGTPAASPASMVDASPPDAAGEASTAPGASDAGMIPVTNVGPTDGGAYAATDAPPPVDNRPPPPSWDPPVALGSPGWRQSTTPLCEPYYGSNRAFAIWADQRGVFEVFGTACPLQELNPCGSSGASVQFNDGTSWRTIYRTDVSVADVLDLNGFAGGPEILAGDSCGITFIGNEAVPTCTTPGGLPTSLYPPRVFGIQPMTAYAISAAQVLQFGAGRWNAMATLDTPAIALWSDGQTVVVAGQNRAYERVGNGTLGALSNVPAGDYLSAWGFGPNDVWLGNGAGQLVHYDGTAWNAIAASPTGSPINKLWGVAGQVYFDTNIEFGRWNGQSVDVLISPQAGAVLNPRVLVRGLWGLSATEIFVSVVDTQFEQYACGGEFILWFDGSQFHRF